jgi:outer membrane protein OmpA-like peptidoglycan-associated protein/tetratricopeptide (TPR) repeat protein
MKAKVLFISLVLLSTMGFAQRKVADKFFKNFAYVKATELYEEAVRKGNDSEHVLTRLGDCYYFNSKTDKAAEWYGKAVNKYPRIDPEYIYKYILSLRSIGDYDTANEWIERFKQTQDPEDILADFPLIDPDEYAKLASTDGVYIETKNLDINSENSDFGGFEFNGKFYFASSRNTLGNTFREVYAWNEEPYLNIFESEVSTENGEKVFSDPKSISPEINTKFHEASIAITSDGNTIYYTRDNITKRNRLKPDRQGTTHLNIYKATLVDGSWVNAEEELPFNGKLFSTGHPALSPDNKTLYFVSDREGGYGMTDIYKVAINDDGTYGDPENLGPNVNTAGKEMFPFVDRENTLYFSSEGFTNLGLLDIFKSDILNDPDAEAENLGAPYNSGGDDFSFFKIKADDESGYFSSNGREDSKGGDDIYSFNSFNCKQFIKGIARDSITMEPLSAVKVELIDTSGKILKTVETDENGAYELEVECDEKYTIRGSKPDYKDELKEVNTSVTDSYENVTDLILQPLIIDDEIVINPIFFDFDKWNIRTDAKYELENIVDVLREHPNMVIKIESHTDSRGSHRYNEKLSDRRAKSTQDYLLSRGIAPERIESAIGFGETQPVNDCGRNCTEEEHQENRRSHFYIVKQ